MTHQSFETPAAFGAWLAANHATAPELWVRIYKKASGVASVTWQDCVVEALAWGWIDSQKRSLDDLSFVQRFCPRRPRSTWSQINRRHVERLIAEGRMRPAGLAHVDAAKADGRWDAAYAGSADLTIPADFLAALADHPAAAAFFATLDRKNLFPIYHRLQTAVRPETRERRLQQILAQLARGERFH